VKENMQATYIAFSRQLAYWSSSMHTAEENDVQEVAGSVGQ